MKKKADGGKRNGGKRVARRREGAAGHVTAVAVRGLRERAAHIAGMEQATDREWLAAIRFGDSQVRQRARRGLPCADGELRDEAALSWLTGALRARGVTVGDLAALAQSERAVAGPAAEEAGPSDAERFYDAAAKVERLEARVKALEGERDGLAERLRQANDKLGELAPEVESLRARIAEQDGAYEELLDRANDSDAEVCRMREKRQALARALARTADALGELARADDRIVG